MGKVEKLKEMVDYQEDSIVSRTIVNRETGTITLFAFEAGQGLSEHTVPYDVMVYLVEGESEMTIYEKRFVLQEGEMIVLPANILYAIRATAQFKMLLVMIKSRQWTWNRRK